MVLNSPDFDRGLKLTAGAFQLGEQSSRYSELKFAVGRRKRLPHLVVKLTAASRSLRHAEGGSGFGILCAQVG